MRLLIIDDEPAVREGFAETLAGAGHEAVACASGREAREAEGAFDAVLVDWLLEGEDGLALAAELMRRPALRRAAFVLVTGLPDRGVELRARRMGIRHFLAKPVGGARWETLLHALAPERGGAPAPASAERLPAGYDAAPASPALRTLLTAARRFHAFPETPVLLEGETGAGKEWLAREIHHGERGDVAEPFLVVNSAALTDSLLGSELFGYEEGAFTGARREGRAGLLEHAGNGTLFLDEVQSMPASLQALLMRVIDERVYCRVGGTAERYFNARLICAANIPLERLIREGRFREDLFHRLSVGRLRIPPLREHPEDIGRLAALFLARQARLKRKRVRRLSPVLLARMRAYAWPGNVRELRNKIEDAVIKHDDEELRLEHMEWPAAAPAAPAAAPPAPAADAAGLDAVEAFRRHPLPEEGFAYEAFADALKWRVYEQCHCNQARAARYLSMTPSKLGRDIRRIKRARRGRVPPPPGADGA